MIEFHIIKLLAYVYLCINKSLKLVHIIIIKKSI